MVFLLSGSNSGKNGKTFPLSVLSQKLRFLNNFVIPYAYTRSGKMARYLHLFPHVNL